MSYIDDFEVNHSVLEHLDKFGNKIPRNMQFINVSGTYRLIVKEIDDVELELNPTDLSMYILIYCIVTWNKVNQRGGNNSYILVTCDNNGVFKGIKEVKVSNALKNTLSWAKREANTLFERVRDTVDEYFTFKENESEISIYANGFDKRIAYFNKNTNQGYFIGNETEEFCNFNMLKFIIGHIFSSQLMYPC